MDMCLDMCLGMCLDMCLGMCKNACAYTAIQANDLFPDGHGCKHVSRHVEMCTEDVFRHMGFDVLVDI